MAIKIENNHISLAVRDLLSLKSQASKTLSSFPLPQRGMLGKQAQLKTQQHKQKSFGLFHREYSVNGEFKIDDYSISVNGRIDGLYELESRLEVEEIKSVILTASEFKNLNIDKYPEFSEQLLFYCYLLQKQNNGIEIIPYLTLVNLVNDRTRNFTINYNQLSVESILYQRLRSIIDEIEREKQFTHQRQSQLTSINFQLTEDRPQQNKMMRIVKRTLADQKHLLASAPTGTGKTAAALIPAVEFSMIHNKKIFFATSKTTQQNIVRETLYPIINSDLDCKTLFLRSAGSMCANDIFFCHEDFCPFAKNYQEKLLKSNLLADLETKSIEPEIVFEKAKQNLICPSEVLFELTSIADIIVGDYNYVFDPSAQLRRLFYKKDYSDWILIVDEAHNLYQRGMDYFSPVLRRREFADLIKLHRRKKTKIFINLMTGLKSFLNIFDDLFQEGKTFHEEQRYFQPSLNLQIWQNYFNEYESAFIKYLIHKVRKKILIQDDPFEILFFKLRRFIQVAKLEGDEFIPFYDAEAGGILKIQCCNPSEQLGNKINQFHSVIGISATLDPLSYYQKVLGFPADHTRTLNLDSPFPTSNRKMIIIPGISTRYTKRHQNYIKYAEIIKSIIGLKSGNYLAFFPSFEFLQNVYLFLGNISHETVIQKKGMSLQERDEILNKLKNLSKPKLLLAVMGGIFSEGVDYYGEMCIGVIIFSPALPQINYERNLIQEYYNTKTGDGFEYAYLYPGLNKVIQSAGRLIRSAQDKGIVVFIGERFAEENINELLPEYWFQNPGDVVITNKYEKEIKLFWKNLGPKKTD